MTTEEKANLMANELDNGINGFGDKCKRNADGTYSYYCEGANQTFICSAEELAKQYDELGL